MRFAGGAVVFPGGAVDAADKAHARSLIADANGDLDEFAARIAAVRETIEECGLLIAARGEGRDAETVRQLRHALKAGGPIAEVSRQYGLEFGYDSLIPFARWCPPTRVQHKRFDTRFFLTVVEEMDALDDLVPDGGESVRLAWHSARDALNEAEAGRLRIIFPTRRNLERLAQCDTIETLIDHARSYPASLISPWIETRDGADHLCIPEGLGYPITSEPLSMAQRA